jgi:hypothetical protein
MSETLWTFPVPATQITRLTFVERPRRECELSFEIEEIKEKEDAIEQFILLFEGVETFRCTYLTSITADMFHPAYGKLVRLGMTPWLAEVSTTYRGNCAKTGITPQGLQHLMICFDDGPCYEVICADVKVPT